MKTLLTWWISFVCALEVRAALKKDLEDGPLVVLTFENDTVVLPCEKDGLEDMPTRVIWYVMQPRTLMLDTGSTLYMPERLKMLDNRNLQVTHVQPEDVGQYACEIVRPDPWGHIIQTYRIELFRPPSISPAYTELEVDMGKEVDMACLATGVPTPIVSWWSKGEELQLLDSRQRLRFQADTRNLSGRYICSASNGVGEPASATIDLRIRHKPEIEASNTLVHAFPGIRVQLNCRVTAFPEAKVDWFFKDQQVPYSLRIIKHNSGSNHSLIIRSVKILDYGYYFCRATNVMGTTEAIIELSGVANSAVLKESHDISNTACNFIWEVDSYSPIIEYQFWFRKRVKDVRMEWHKLFIPSGSDAIGPVHARSFNLTGLTEATHYEALVLSRNRFGWSRPSTILRFATRGADSSSVDDNERLKAEIVPEEKEIPVVEFASMCQHSSFDAESNEASTDRRSGTIIVILAVLYISIIIQHRHIIIA